MNDFIKNGFEGRRVEGFKRSHAREKIESRELTFDATEKAHALFNDIIKEINSIQGNKITEKTKKNWKKEANGLNDQITANSKKAIKERADIPDKLKKILDEIKETVQAFQDSSEEEEKPASKQTEAIKKEVEPLTPFTPEEKLEEQQVVQAVKIEEEPTVEPIVDDKEPVALEENLKVITPDTEKLRSAMVKEEPDKILLENCEKAEALFKEIEKIKSDIKTANDLGVAGDPVLNKIYIDSEKLVKKIQKIADQQEGDIENQNKKQITSLKELEEKKIFLEKLKISLENRNKENKVAKATVPMTEEQKLLRKREDLWAEILKGYRNMDKREYRIRFDLLKIFFRDIYETDRAAWSEEKIKEWIEEEMKVVKGIKIEDEFEVRLIKGDKGDKDFFAELPGKKKIIITNPLKLPEKAKEGDFVKIKITRKNEYSFNAMIVSGEDNNDKGEGKKEGFEQSQLSTLYTLLNSNETSQKDKEMIRQALEKKEEEKIKEDKEKYQKYFGKYKEEFYQEKIKKGKSEKKAKIEASKEARWKAILEVIGQKVEEITYSFLNTEEVKKLKELKEKDLAEFEEEFRKISRETWQFAIHGKKKSKKAGEETVSTDLDVKACLVLFGKAQFNNIEDTIYIPAGEFVPGRVNIDTSERRGIGTEGDTSWMDHHLWFLEKESICAAQWVYLALLSKGFIEKDPALDKALHFVSRIDRAEFPEIENYFGEGEEGEKKGAYKTIAGLSRYVRFEDLYNYYKDVLQKKELIKKRLEDKAIARDEREKLEKTLKENPATRILSAEELEEYHLTKASEKQKENNKISKEELEKLEKNNFVIKTDFGDMVVDINKQIPGGYQAVRAYNNRYGYFIFNSKDNSFFITNRNADFTKLDTEQGVERGKCVRRSMWTYRPSQGEFIKIFLKDLIKKLGGKIPEEGGLKKYIDKEDFGKVLNEIFIEYEKDFKGKDFEDREKLLNYFFDNFGKEKEEFKRYEEEIKTEQEKLKGAMSGEKWNLFKERVKEIMEEFLKDSRGKKEEREIIKKMKKKIGGEKIKKIKEMLRKDITEETIKKLIGKNLEKHSAFSQLKPEEIEEKLRLYFIQLKPEEKEKIIEKIITGKLRAFLLRHHAEYLGVKK